MTEAESVQRLKRQIAAWLAVTGQARPSVGLDEQEASRRADDLLSAILENRVRPESLEPNEETKQVLSIIVRRLKESILDPGQRLHQADAVYQFIRRLRWPTDEFGEQRDLLLECAEIGWGAIGLSVTEVDERRRSKKWEQMQRFGADPIPNLPALIGALSEQLDMAPNVAARGAEDLYGRLCGRDLGLFDEKGYFLGEISLIAGGAHRHLGNYEKCAAWVGRAQAAFLEMVNSESQLANVSYASLALSLQKHHFEEILECVPSLMRSYERLGMTAELHKAQFLRAMSLKLAGRDREAMQRFKELHSLLSPDGDQALLGYVLIEVGSYLASNGCEAEAAAEYQRAAKLLEASGRAMALAHLRVMIGEGCRDQGNLPGALAAFRSAVDAFLRLGMATFAAYVRLFLAETLIALNCSREAEQEILAALPTIEEQKMVPEGLAAVALLKESVRRRKTDRNALRELREHLQVAQKK